MELKVFKSLWGMDRDVRKNVARIKAAGHEGVEAAVQELSNPAEFRSLLDDHGLELIALVYTEGPDHLEHLKRVVEGAMRLAPTKIVAHAGRDLMPFVKQIRFLIQALRLEESAGIPIAHETHRRRPLYSPMNTLAILRELPELKVNIDFSHWCCVTESMLEDHVEAVELASEHAVHLHSRVGFENGPQVADPRAPEWSQHVLAHESWWEEIIRDHLARTEPFFTVTPEYGPPTYMQTQPYTQEPSSDLWEICLDSADRFRKFFDETLVNTTAKKAVQFNDIKVAPLPEA